MDLIVTGLENTCKFDNVKAVLLDLDGTLINTLDLHIEAFQWILKRLGKQVSKEELESLMGRTPHDIISSFFSDITPEEAWKAATEKEGYLESLIKEVQPFPGVKTLLTKFGSHGVRRVVISSTYRRLVETLLKNAGLIDQIDSIVSGEDIVHGKPDPEPFTKGLRAAGVEETAAIGIGDSVHDAISCMRAGIRFIGVLTGKTSNKQFLDNDVRCVVSTFQHIDLK